MMVWATGSKDLTPFPFPSTYDTTPYDKKAAFYPKRLFNFIIRPMLPSTLYFPDIKAV